MKKVYKYGTGMIVPEGAVYLSTQTETVTDYEYHENGSGLARKLVSNLLVWHYFLVDEDEKITLKVKA